MKIAQGSWEYSPQKLVRNEEDDEVVAWPQPGLPSKLWFVRYVDLNKGFSFSPSQALRSLSLSQLGKNVMKLAK